MLTYRPYLAILILSISFHVSHTAVGQVHIDSSAIPIFWEIADTLSTDHSPSAALWEKFATHPAYVQIQASGNRVSFLKKVLPLVFMPSKSEQLKKLLEGKESAFQYFAQHLVEVKAQRKELAKFLTEADFEDYKFAYRKSLSYLPLDIEEDQLQLNIYLALFEDNGFGGKVITMDLLHLLRGSPQENHDFFAHEFHHALRGHTQKHQVYTPTSNATYPIIEALNKIPLEGVASLLDKNKYFDQAYYGNTSAIHPNQKETIEEFQQLVAAAPTHLAQIDSILISTASPAEKRKKIFQQLPWSGHVIGFYMSSAIEKYRGQKMLVKAQYSCVRFFLQYQKATKKDESLYCFTKEAITALKALKK